MADIVQVKAEIKAWEREFKDNNGRQPKVPDIDANPAIAAKYKLYKKLSKAKATVAPTVASSAGASSSAVPATPSKQSSARLLPKSRVAVEMTVPLASFNPFSPTKNRIMPQTSPAAMPPIPTNPFATPSRPKGKTSLFTREMSPPAPFLIPEETTTPQSMASRTPANIPSAISRARKRLRGEAVSPSPAKEKRRRLASEEPPPSPTTNGSIMDEDEDIFTDAGNSSFVDDSPVKNSSFKLLFDESSAAAKAISKPLFPPRASSQRLSPSLEESEDRKPRVKSERLFPTIFPSNRPVRDLPSRRDSALRGKSSDKELTAPTTSTSRKRVLSVSEAASSEEQTSRVPSLVPPSPPPETSKRTTGPYKGKGKAAKNDRKKPKLAVAESEEEEESDEIPVIVHSKPRSQRAPHSSDGDGDDMFPLPSKRPDEARKPVETDQFEVDLPDKLRHVLAFSPTDSKTELHEGRMFEGLLYGRRTDNYDASKGGEVWDVGEHEDDEVEEEDDWEGEPIPWENGEL